MRRLTPPAVALALMLAMPTAAAEKVTEHDRFRLWNGCRPVFLSIGPLPTAATNIGLTRKAIEVAARSRLRSARLYDDDASTFLWVNVNATSFAHGITVGYFKWARDEASDITSMAMTWFTGSTGTHGRSAPNVLSVVTEFVDEFIDEYLRVNAAACGKSK